MGEGNTRSIGVAELPGAEVLDVFHKVKQKFAVLRSWVGGVHQIVIWVGTARPGKRAGARR